MNIYKARPEIDGFRWLDSLTFEKAVELDGNYQTRWSPLELKWVERHKRTPRFVFVGMTGMAVDMEVAHKMQEKTLPGIQFLPIQNISTHLILNPINLPYALDYEKSIVDRFDSGGILSIDEHAFRKKEVEQAFLFKIPEVSRFYATQNFKDLYDQEGWTGLDFEFLCEAQ